MTTTATTKVIGETQTLRASCSKASQKILPRCKPPSRGAGWPKFNQLEMVTTFIYKRSLVKIDAHNFKLSLLQTNKHTNRQVRLQNTLMQLSSAQCNNHNNNI